MSQAIMLSDVGLSLGDNTAMETTQTGMPSSARMLEPLTAEKASKPGEGGTLPGKMGTQFNEYKDGKTVNEGQLVSNGTVGNNVNGVNGDNGVSCTFYHGVCRIHRVKGTKNTVSRTAWPKKKFGYGYSTTKKVIWSCNDKDGNPGDNNDVSTSDLSQMPVDKREPPRGI